jgi:hypothetical protein
MLDERKAAQIVQSVFTYDYVGETMSALRRDLKSESLQEKLLEELIMHARSQAKDDSPEAAQAIRKAAEASLEVFVNGSKAAKSTGCGS